jgi:hypothetical protein
VQGLLPAAWLLALFEVPAARGGAMIQVRRLSEVAIAQAAAPRRSLDSFEGCHIRPVTARQFPESH